MSIEQAVHCEVVGQGPALVLLHGWGVNSAVWQPIIAPLSEHFCLYLVDLPGFGESKPLAHYSLQSISEAIQEVVPESAVWCGWSLGGLIATYTAINYPQQVTQLIQVASSVKFVADEQWEGVDGCVFDNFLQGLQTNPQKTLARFIALQAMGCKSARQDSNKLKKLLSGTQDAEQSALIAGLNLLAGSDLRSSFSSLSQPCLSMFGQSDGLVPLQTATEMSILLPDLQVQLFEHSSHAPFISESELFCNKIVNFIAG
ncbi:pimeloyl-[acyl-carrier protein] methyl ester esterase [Psychromonas marina]|uniref:Pimeloyl-[acyl-carrier protein] methyl ester esterase n=1 Tax=Psychromonas marina TaxID=88364 RepID=A0ABQ6E0E9_9GAMM|nr:pimeloyl-ACP methyl ester esterase BioH [Psychromonas marina]GLS90822.1 pimeloyl-[acyl-carrier protein] methyl ester esterase [Psychromonas marina]